MVEPGNQREDRNIKSCVEDTYFIQKKNLKINTILI